MAIRTLCSRWRSEEGAEIIEFALVAPLLILLFAAIVDFGNMFRSFEAVTNAAREGARVGVLPAYQDADVYIASTTISTPPVYTTRIRHRR